MRLSFLSGWLSEMQKGRLKMVIQLQKGLMHCPVCTQPGFSVTEKKGKTLAYCHYSGCSWAEIMKALQNRGGIQPQSQSKSFNKVKIQEYALRLWHESLSGSNTLVAAYLRARGYKGDVPFTLRYLSEHKHTLSQSVYPVMLAKISNQNGQFQAIHRTYLQPDRPEKAQVSPAKMSLGPVRGGAIRLSVADDELIVCEGIETGLALLQETAMAVWSCISAAGLKAVQLPISIEKVIVAADNDSAGLQAAKSAARRFYDEGRVVKLITPVKPGTDFADQLFYKGNA